jgi:glycosyltransferase involved in cell wall biosynthesis
VPPVFAEPIAITMKSMVKRDSVLVVCCTDASDPNWRWLEGPLAGSGIRFEFARAFPRNRIERAIQFLNLPRVRGSFEAVSLARRKNAQIVVTHGPALAAWCGFFASMVRLRIPIIAHSFNFTELPGRAKRLAFSRMLAKIDRFIVFSTVERTLYAKAFSLPEARFDVVLWGVRPPTVDPPNTPLQEGEYICAIGGNARDYETLMKAARLLPDIRFVCVVRPDNLKGFDIPPNVFILTNLPLGNTMNILKYSRLMVLPLLHSEVPCGHVTIVAAMHLGKAMVVTDSEGVRDYVRDGFNALTAPARSAPALAEIIQRLWSDADLRRRLGENGQAFAARECTEERTVEHFTCVLAEKGLLPNSTRSSSSR